MKEVLIGQIAFNDISLSQSDVHKLRGYIGSEFAEFDLIHNHDGERDAYFYRYPLVQFKVIRQTPILVAVTEPAINIFKEILFKTDKIIIGETVIPVYEKSFSIKTKKFGIANKPLKYRFITPWIGLNQQNYRKYENAAGEERSTILTRSLIGNLLSMSKTLDYTVPEQITVTHDLRPVNVNLKGKTMLGFTGSFTINFYIPSLLGIGKSPSRGNGALERVKEMVK